MMDAQGGVARKKLSVADHILTQTYPLVRDPKLLLAVLQNIVAGLDSAVEDALARDVAAKRIVSMPQDSEARLSALRGLAEGYGIGHDFFRFAEELRETLKEHAHSPVEFVRKDRLVICDDKYKVRTLSEEQLKGELQRARAFIEAIERGNSHDPVAPRRH